jgi:cytochrome c oxidase assembly protein subunit 15
MTSQPDTPLDPGAATARHIANWLFFCAAIVAIMVLLGGATRLTESGLSIVQWKPFTGILPPLVEADWQRLFDAYQDSPEFRRINFWMSLADYKTIFWLEYLHRLWGRLIGVVFLIPFVWFLIRGTIERPMIWRLGGVFLLGGLQGLLGWYMVKSGLVDEPGVSQYRLAAHLCLALVIYALLLWYGFRYRLPRGTVTRSHRTVGIVLLCWTSVTVFWGALVAGMDAGLAYNSFPLMDGKLVPDGAFSLSPWWLNPFENTAAVQFIHRVLGIGLVLVALFVGWNARHKTPALRRAGFAVAGMALVQLGLGIATLLSAVALPLGVAHQIGALMLLTLAVWFLYVPGVGDTEADRRANSTAPSK